MAPARIALCITDLDVGGAERCLVQLATRLDRTRFSPEVYCIGPRPMDDASSCAPPLEEAKIPVHCLGGRGYRDVISVVRRLSQLLAQQNPQILQAFLFHANLLGRLAARRSGVPRVLSGIRVAERHAHWHLWLDRMTCGMVDRHVCVSHAVARFSARRSKLPADKIVVIPNGIDPGQFPAAQRADLTRIGIPAEKRAITFVGRLTRQKGLAWFLKAAPRWLGRLSDCDLLLVGKGPQERRLRQLASQLDIADRVHFAGWQADIPGILAASHLLVLPSRWEGMPNVVLQAMATALPVLATDVEGIVELLGESAEKQSVNYGDSESLAGNLVAIMSDPDWASRLGEENRLRAVENFTVGRMVDAYQSLWESLIER